ncbi:hypothetical protein O3G_MSEX002886 [Manduca sexta]|uniref:Gustatory receptor 17 n=1 Tax=Manduca sexta TaxID=7130 RepID=A0A5K8B1B9_MANSE|nr:hypothetical protein O3G_MSEX002886 [Manduca sexta]CUQ99358.1 TPA: Gustatory receptor 17 [Manduca sexta]
MNSELTKYFTKHLTILKMLKFLRILMGYYNPTNLSQPLVWTARAYSFTIWLITLYSLIKYFFVLYVFHIADITLSLYTGDEFFFKYYRATETNDIIIGNKLSVFNIGIKFIILVTIAFRLLLTCLKIRHFKSHTNFNLNFFTINFVIIASRLTCLLVTTVLVVLYVRMKYLRQRMERNTVPVNIISKNFILSKVREVRRCLLYYNTLLDSVADIDRELQCSVNIIYILTRLNLTCLGYENHLQMFT